MNLAKWLLPRERESSEYGFRVLDFVEACDVDEDISKYLAEQIVVHHGDPAMIRDECLDVLEDLRGLGQGDLANALGDNLKELTRSRFTGYLDESVLPDENAPFNPRIGNWGEIVCATLLVDLEGFWLPIHKLRYREKKDYSPRLTDLCVIRRDGPKPLVCLGEVKTHSSACNKNLGVKGLESLVAGDVFEKPEILHFVVNQLYSQGRREDGRFISHIRMGRIDSSRRYDLYLVHESKYWDEEILQRLDDQEMDEMLVNFSVRVLLIRDLRDLIYRCYENCWRAVLELIT